MSNSRSRYLKSRGDVVRLNLLVDSARQPAVRSDAPIDCCSSHRAPLRCKCRDQRRQVTFIGLDGPTYELSPVGHPYFCKLLLSVHAPRHLLFLPHRVNDCAAASVTTCTRSG